jgi:hypothetical protein
MAQLCLEMARFYELQEPSLHSAFTYKPKHNYHSWLLAGAVLI